MPYLVLISENNLFFQTIGQIRKLGYDLCWYFMGFDRLGDILQKNRSRHSDLDRRLSEAEAWSRWQEAVGPLIAKYARAVSVRQGILYVEVDHPVWYSELHHRKHQILSVLQDKEKIKLISDIVFLNSRTGNHSSK